MSVWGDRLGELSWIAPKRSDDSPIGWKYHERGLEMREDLVLVERARVSFWGGGASNSNEVGFRNCAP